MNELQISTISGVFNRQAEEIHEFDLHGIKHDLRTFLTAI